MAGLTLDDLVGVATRTLGPSVRVRDLGLLGAALARVDTRVGRHRLYPTVEEQAAALLHSLAITAPLDHGNRAFAWIATAVFLAREGRPSELDDAQAVALVTDVLTGRLDTVASIAGRLRAGPAADRG